MSYRDFTLKEVQRRFGLTIAEFPDLFALAPEVAPSQRLQEMLAETLPLAQDINTEKARSELVIAPVLLEVRSQLDRRISFFSGVEFNVDPEKGLNGYCDFLLANSPQQLFITAPLIVVVEAKKEDIKEGMAQCAATMVAARLFNEREEQPARLVFGAVTTGTSWRFLQYDGQTVAIDQREYPLGDRLAKILGTFVGMFARDDQQDPLYDQATGVGGPTA